MSSYILRFLKSSIPSKRLVSQLTQRGEGKLGALLRQLGLQKMLGVFELGSKEGTGKRGLSTTAPMAQKPLTDDMELATGIFKRELQLRQAGCDDPWAMARPMKRGAGRENDPTVITSAFDGRLVGCLCLGDRSPKWMWLEKGSPKRCECGHYYVLKKADPI